MEAKYLDPIQIEFSIGHEEIERLIYLRLCDGWSNNSIERDEIYPSSMRTYLLQYGIGALGPGTPIERFGDFFIVPFAYNADKHAEAISIAMQLFPELY